MSKQNLVNLRHSASHLLAAAIISLYPEAKPTLGPPVDDGFYYDFDNLKVSEENFPKIEAEMLKIVKGWDKFKKELVSAAKAIQAFKGNQYKEELINDFLKKGQEITLYKSGSFVDLCRGGHVNNPAKELKHFKLLSVAGAYWRGDEKNKMLTRIYGTAFPTKKELEDYLEMLQKAKKNDHRVISKQLDYYSISPLTGPGLILWHPKLAIVRNIVEQFWKEEHLKSGYKLVYTPHIASMDMFVKSRHYNKYIDSMFPAMLHEHIGGESRQDYSTDEQLKPMNCPNHIQIFNSRPRSYRELPIRMGELGTVYRYERAGTLHGMTRVRGFTQDDSHIFCTPEQVIDEVRGVIRLTKSLYDIFGFSGYRVYIATRPKKYLGSLEMWNFAEDSLKKAAKAEGLDYEIDKGQGVFYGPKIDSKVKDSLGREWQLGTNQFDFNMPANEKSTKKDLEEYWAMKTFKEKFGSKVLLWKYLQRMGRGYNVQYIDKNGNKKQTIMIHRTVLGSMERFFGVLIEHYAGAFPVWLASTQIKILPITERNYKYANSVFDKLRNEGLRIEVDDRNETLPAKIRDAQLEKIPYILVVGDKEEKVKKVALRPRTGKDLGQIDLDKFINYVHDKVDTKDLIL